MKSDNFLLSKRITSEKVSLYKNKNFTLEFKFKNLDFYNEIYYLRKIKKFDLMFSNRMNGLQSSSCRKNIS